MSTQEEKLAIAKKVVQNKLDFIRHFVIYVFVIAVLAVINNLSFSGYQWWVWPALGWGIGVFSHFLSTFIFQGGALEKKLVEKEMERMDGKS